MTLYQELQTIPDELLTGAQVRRKEKMAEVASEYKNIREKYGDSSIISLNRICEFLAVKHNISVRTARYYLEHSGVLD